MSGVEAAVLGGGDHEVTLPEATVAVRCCTVYIPLLLRATDS